MASSPSRFSAWLYTGIGMVTILLLLRHFLLVPVSVEVDMSSNVLWTGDTTAVILRIIERNRLSQPVPFSNPALECEFESGRELVSLTYNDDSTIVSLRSTGGPGLVGMRILTPASLFPLYVEIPVLTPTAARTPSSERRLSGKT